MSTPGKPPDEVKTENPVERFWALFEELRRRPFGEVIVTMRGGRPVGVREVGQKRVLDIAPRTEGPSRPES